MSSERAADTAGALLRAAREKQGLHIAALAASIKVSPRKLEALEADRYDELSGGTFTRALAQSVCRALRIDAAPVLALLPPAEAVALDHVTGTLNAPFRERPSRDDAGVAIQAQRWLIGGAALLLVAALVTLFVPNTWWRSDPAPAVVSAPVAASAVSVVKVPAAPPVAAPATPTPVVAVASAPPGAASSAAEVQVMHLAPAPGLASAPVAGLLRLSTSDGSWIEVRDGQGRILLSRTVQRGEAVGVDGATPFRLTVGNAAATQVQMRGQSIDLAAATRDNVARIELK